jgi:hypothetical protein
VHHRVESFQVRRRHISQVDFHGRELRTGIAEVAPHEQPYVETDDFVPGIAEKRR